MSSSNRTGETIGAAPNTLRRRGLTAFTVALIVSSSAGCGSGGADEAAGGLPTELPPATAAPDEPTAPDAVSTEVAPSSSPSTTTSSTSASSTTSIAASTTADEAGGDDVDTAWTVIEVVDASRPTDEVLGPDGGVLLAASASRTIPTVILYPGSDGGGEGAPVASVEARPLVVWLNGLGGRAGAEDPLLQALAEAGYVVAAPNTPEIAAPVGSAGGFVHLPGDATAVVDALTRPDDGVADELAPVIDTGRVGVAGHSIGGTGAYGVAYHDCCRDDRISAVAVFAPPSGAPFEGGEYRFSGPPLLIIHGTADQVIPIEQSDQVRDEADDAVLVSPIDADHFQPVYGNERPDVLEVSEELLTTFFDVHVAGLADPIELDDVLAENAETISVR